MDITRLVDTHLDPPNKADTYALDTPNYVLDPYNWIFGGCPPNSLQMDIYKYPWFGHLEGVGSWPRLEDWRGLG